MAMIPLSVASFRTMFPEFVNATTYPDVMIEMNWSISTSYVSADDYGWLAGDARSNALYFLTAHMTKLGAMIANGQNPALVSSSSIDKVSISTTPPPVTNQFHWWLSLTSYGATLLALLQVNAIGGFIVGGTPERSAFRKVGGIF